MNRDKHGREGSCVAEPMSAESLNRGCACRFLDAELLQHQLEGDASLAGLAQEIARTRPSLFSATQVFVTPLQRERMMQIVAAVEEVVTSSAWQDYVLASAPSIARQDSGPRGVFLGFDFHLDEQGAQLIEINTNAGGALLNAALVRAQVACCEPVAALQIPATDFARLDAELIAMFRKEWQLQRGEACLRTIAIVDDAPQEQYLHPEFLLFQRMFEREGLRALIVDPRDMLWESGRLLVGSDAIDMVYNRLTDFYLEAPEHAALRQAHEAGAVVLTPSPRAHALYADKRHLAVFSDERALATLGVAAATRAVLLEGVPATQIVSIERAETLWAERKSLFFKPSNGFGSRAAYRGDKLTRRVWDEILAGDYVAQKIAHPSERLVATADQTCPLKLDVRAYVYEGHVQLFAARLYAGQTTNFRTPGGGFAPVFIVAS